MPAQVFRNTVVTWVDVKDVAEIVVRALEKEGDVGERYFAGTQCHSMPRTSSGSRRGERFFAGDQGSRFARPPDRTTPGLNERSAEDAAPPAPALEMASRGCFLR